MCLLVPLRVARESAGMGPSGSVCSRDSSRIWARLGCASRSGDLGGGFGLFMRS